MKNVWIGLVNVIPQLGSSTLSNGAKGAFVNVLAFAGSDSEYESVVQAALSTLELLAVEFEDVELFNRLTTEGASDDLQALAKDIRSMRAVAFGTFHNYFADG
jgi:hypothetical protein